MNFKSALFPGVKIVTSCLRVRLPHDRVLSTRHKQTGLFFSIKINKLIQPTTNWRVSPVTGQLERRCNPSDSEDPQSRSFIA